MILVIPGTHTETEHTILPRNRDNVFLDFMHTFENIKLQIVEKDKL